MLTSNGEILTNNHVIDGATSISVTDVGNGKTYKATVVGYDRDRRHRGAAAPRRLRPADGDPRRLVQRRRRRGRRRRSATPAAPAARPSAAGGTVTALNQSITASDEASGTSEQLTGLIEINADIQPGDSGGPLVDTSGEVDRHRHRRLEPASGSSHRRPGVTASPSRSTPPRPSPSRSRPGNASATIHIGETAFLGVETTSNARGGRQSNGPVVLSVVSGSPAESAGLTRGDVITSVAGTSVADATALTNLLDGHHPGDKVKVAWIDVSGQSHSSTVKLTTGPVG